MPPRLYVDREAGRLFSAVRMCVAAWEAERCEKPEERPFLSHETPSPTNGSPLDIIQDTPSPSVSGATHGPQLLVPLTS